MPLAGAVDFDLRVALEDSEAGKDEANSTLGDGERVRARRVDMERLLDECECELRLKASAAGMFIVWSSTSARTGRAVVSYWSSLPLELSSSSCTTAAKAKEMRAHECKRRSAKRKCPNV